MSSKPPPWLDPKPANVGTLVRGLLALGAVFVGAFALMRGSPNAGIFLVLAVVCVGFALVSLFAQGLQRFGGSLLARTLRLSLGSQHGRCPANPRQRREHEQQDRSHSGLLARAAGVNSDRCAAQHARLNFAPRR